MILFIESISGLVPADLGNNAVLIVSKVICSSLPRVFVALGKEMVFIGVMLF